ncbi:hypothetical protein D082_12890 [Synechocystis sp. PCC 6714]|nr:hypothetical protein D082_12890 [Synechocystis sp. PCC 6714]
MWQCAELVLTAFPFDGIINAHLFADTNLFGHGFDQALFFAQSVREVDILGDFQDAWNNFIKTGQVWALIIGFVLGWGFRGFTGG